MENKTAEVSLDSTNYKVIVNVAGHELIADEPTDLGGTDAGPTATHLLLSSLGACTAVTMRMYAERKGWELGRINIHLSIEQENINGTMHSNISREISFENALTSEQRGRMLVIADKCPVHKTLVGELTISTK